MGLTLADLVREETVRALGALESGSIGGLLSLRIGGLRAGWAGTKRAALVLHDYSYVPGVTVSGKVTATEVVLHIGGSAAAAGTLRLGSHHRLSGTLGGQRVLSSLLSDRAADGGGRSVQATSTAASDAIVRLDAQAGHSTAAGGSAARAVRSRAGPPPRSARLTSAPARPAPPRASPARP